MVLPSDYPLEPPSIAMVTPIGRWATGEKIGLSDRYMCPAVWQPAFGIRKFIEALVNDFHTVGEGIVGTLNLPPETRQHLAKASLHAVCPYNGRTNRDRFQCDGSHG